MRCPVITMGNIIPHDKKCITMGAHHTTCIPHVITVLPDRNKHVQHDGRNACMMDATPSLKRKWKIEGEKQKHQRELTHAGYMS